MNKKKVCKIAGAAVAGALLVSGTAFYGLNQSGMLGNIGTNVNQNKVVEFGQVAPTDAGAKNVMKADQLSTTKKQGITIHYKWEGAQPHLYYEVEGSNEQMSYPGVPMKDEGNGWYSYTVSDADAANFKLSVPELDYQTSEFSREEGEYWYDDTKGWAETAPSEYEAPEQKPTLVTQAPVAEREVAVDASDVAKESGIVLHFPGDWDQASIYFWNVLPQDQEIEWPGKQLEKDADGYYTYTIEGATKANFLYTDGSQQTEDYSVKGAGEYWYSDGKWTSNGSSSGTDNDGDKPVQTKKPTPTRTPSGEIVPSEGGDFRDETIYFMMTTRFYDGDESNNRYCWDGPAANKANNDPEWRGDFKGAAEKLDYIKALGFSAIWITPVVENASGYDYHGYHALDFSKVDARYESSDYSYQDFINDCHKKGIKVIQDIVLNHTGNWGETNLYQMFEKGEDDGEMSPSMLVGGTHVDRLEAGAKMNGGDYEGLIPGNQYGARISAMKEDYIDTEKIYHHCKSLSWNGVECQLGQIAGDCVDLNTENQTVYNYLNDCYDNYIKMGVDGFRVDTVKHISRLTFNKTFIPNFKKTGGDDFYIFGECCARYNEVWNERVVPISVCFYTWAEQEDWAWSDTDESVNSASANSHFDKYKSAQESQPTSNNEILEGNDYHAPDYSQASGFNQIDFMMHWGFRDAQTAFGQGLTEDKYFNDSSWNVVYVDSHDYAPDNAPENQRFAGTQDTWAENLDLMFTFRGIPCIYYGSEIEFKKGKPIDVGPNAALDETGRAYFGDHIEGSVDVTDYGVYSNATGAMAETLNYPLAKHIQRLNLIRRAVPALRKGQYSTADISGSGMSYKRRYTANGEDSYVLVNLSGSATFNNVLAGTYVELVTGKTVQSNGSLTTESVGKGNMRVYVLQNDTASAYGATGKIGEDGTYLK